MPGVSARSLSRRACLRQLAGVCLAAGLGSGPGRGHAASVDWRLAADFDPAAAVWLGFAHGHDHITAGLAAALKPHVKLKYLLRDEDHAERLRPLLAQRGLGEADYEQHVFPAAGYFMRDLVLFARGPGHRVGVVDVHSTLYGTPVWCARRHALDATAAADCAARGMDVAEGRTKVDRGLAQLLAAAVLPTPLSAEGGGIEVNGRGLLLANAPYWASRNPELTRAQLQDALLALPGIRKLVWLHGGLAEDVHLRGTIVGDHVAWGTGGHTDLFVRFADERTVLLAWPSDAQALAHPVAAATRRVMARNFDVLSRSTDTRGRTLRVLKVPMPAIIQRPVTLHEQADTNWSQSWSADFFAPQERRRQGQVLQQVASATYLNFVVANGALVLPDYTPHGTSDRTQWQVQRLFESAFDGRRPQFLDAITANWVGGGLHCATVNQPA